MRKLDLSQIIQRQQINEQLVGYANNLANQLIVEFDVNDGFQMAKFLGVSQGLDNYTAIRVWAERWLRQQYGVFDNSDFEALSQDDTVFRKLKNQFLTHFPEAAVA